MNLLFQKQVCYDSPVTEELWRGESCHFGPLQGPSVKGEKTPEAPSAKEWNEIWMTADCRLLV